MQPTYRDDPSNHLPEVHQQEQSYIYSVPDQSSPYALPQTKDYSPLPPTEVATARSGAHKGWKRWWILALIGFLIAILAGLVGGFIGQAIQKGREPSSPAPTAPTAPTNSNSSATTPNYPPGTIGTIVIPKTGCNFPESKERRSISNSTVYTRTRYTTVCNSGWLNTGLAGIWTLTPSDCIEACIQYNAYAEGRPKSERTCVGGGFIPAWTDRTTKRDDNGAPFNCYLQSNASGIQPNNREDDNVEVVALCLEGKCNGAT
jgi:hypothetical protein